MCGLHSLSFLSSLVGVSSLLCSALSPSIHPFCNRRQRYRTLFNTHNFDSISLCTPLSGIKKYFVIVRRCCCLPAHCYSVTVSVTNRQRLHDNGHDYDLKAIWAERSRQRQRQQEKSGQMQTINGRKSSRKGRKSKEQKLKRKKMDEMPTVENLLASHRTNDVYIQTFFFSLITCRYYVIRCVFLCLVPRACVRRRVGRRCCFAFIWRKFAL